MFGFPQKENPRKGRTSTKLYEIYLLSFIISRFIAYQNPEFTDNKRMTMLDGNVETVSLKQ